MSDFDTECPRCARNKASEPTNNVPVSTTGREDVVRNSTSSPSKVMSRYPFPVGGKAFVARNATRYGPYSLEDINNYLKSGNILQSDQLLTDSREWIVLRRIEGVILPPPEPPSKPQKPPAFTPPIPGETTPYNDSFNHQPLTSELPAELKGFNWGAAYWTWIWGIAHKHYWPLVILPAMFIPAVGGIVSLGFVIYFGIKGNELAWKKRKWESIEQFKATQKVWRNWAIGTVIFCVVMLPIIIFSGVSLTSIIGH